MSKIIPYIIILILAAALSFFIGAYTLGARFSSGTGNITETAEKAIVEEAETIIEEAAQIVPEDQADDTDAPAPVRKKGAVASFFFPDIDSDKGLQKKLTDKSIEISGIREVLDSAGASHSSDSPLHKMSGALLFASGVIAFEKYLLFTASRILLFVITPIFIIISVVLMIINRDKRITPKLIFKTIFFSLIIIFILPVSFYLSALIENILFSGNINYLIALINEGAGLIGSAMNYFIIFIFTFIIFPASIITGIICVIKYFKKRLLSEN